MNRPAAAIIIIIAVVAVGLFALVSNPVSTSSSAEPQVTGRSGGSWEPADLASGAGQKRTPAASSDPGSEMISTAPEGESSGRVWGRVFDAEGQPLVGATVRLSGPQGAPSDGTSTAGEYEIRGVPPGEYDLSVSPRSSEGLGRVYVEKIQVLPGDDLRQDLYLEGGGVEGHIVISGLTESVRENFSEMYPIALFRTSDESRVASGMGPVAGGYEDSLEKAREIVRQGISAVAAGEEEAEDLERMRSQLALLEGIGGTEPAVSVNFSGLPQDYYELRVYLGEVRVDGQEVPEPIYCATYVDLTREDISDAVWVVDFLEGIAAAHRRSQY